MKNGDKKAEDKKVRAVMWWFRRAVTYEGEPYTVDAEQARAIVCDAKNAIVVARAGSGKTRTIVAKIAYLVAQCGMKPDEIMAFVFNANAAAEVNMRLAKIMVDGRPLMARMTVASTFHAFARKVVFKVCGQERKYGRILVDDREEFVRAILEKHVPRGLVQEYLRVDEGRLANEVEEEYAKLVKNVALFINRAQQMYFGDVGELRTAVTQTVADAETEKFWRIGMICYEKYHDYLAGRRDKRELEGVRNGNKVDLRGYGIDFNLLMKCAGILIRQGGEEVRRLLGKKKWILVDEYQDFSALFLNMVQAIREVCGEARLFVVGDDWQAINRFAGGEVEYFKEFRRYFAKDARQLAITTNYRCDKLIVDNARVFMRRAMQERGKFRAKSRRLGKVVLVDTGKCGEVENVYRKNISTFGAPLDMDGARYLKMVVEILRANVGREVLILHRNNEVSFCGGMALNEFRRRLKRTVVERLMMMSEGDFERLVRVMTMHKSKGLEAEVVIIMEADAGVIPAKHAGAALFLVFRENEQAGMEDQKRLFYVAITRAKRRLYIIHKMKKKGENGFIEYLDRKLMDEFYE